MQAACTRDFALRRNHSSSSPVSQDMVSSIEVGRENCIGDAELSKMIGRRYIWDRRANRNFGCRCHPVPICLGDKSCSVLPVRCAFLTTVIGPRSSRTGYFGSIACFIFIIWHLV